MCTAQEDGKKNYFKQLKSVLRCLKAQQQQQQVRATRQARLRHKLNKSAVGDSSTTCLLSHTQNLLGLPAPEETQAPSPGSPQKKDSQSKPHRSPRAQSLK